MTLRIHPQVRHITLLLLEKEIHVLLLHNEGQLELRNVEGKFLRVEDSQHVNLLYDSLHTALQLAHSLLLVRIVCKNVLENILRNRHLLIKVDILERARKKEGLRNGELLLRGITPSRPPPWSSCCWR